MSVNDETSDTKQAAANQEPGQGIDRRGFFNRLSLALSGLAGVLVGVPVIGFLISPLLREVPRICARSERLMSSRKGTSSRSRSRTARRYPGPA